MVRYLRRRRKDDEQLHPAAVKPRDNPTSDVGDLQQRAGNRAVAQLLTEGGPPLLVAQRKKAYSSPAAERHDTYHGLEGDMGKYAVRVGRAESDFKDVDKSLVAKALSLPRGPNGELSVDAIDLMNDKTQADAKITLLDKYAGFGVTDQRKGLFKDAQLKKALKKAGNLNILSNKSKYPELANLLKTSKGTDADVQTTESVGGVSMQVTHNTSDVNYRPRLALLEAAVGRVTAAGFKVPPLDVRIPKWSRTITVKKDCTVQIDGETSAAQYLAPNLMHLGAGGLANPQEKMRTNPETGEEEPYFMSASVDLSGTGTVVHELGHAVHYAASPSSFHNLHFTQFAKGNTIAEKVSGYATNPREFVAEVFTGLVYGRKFPQDVMDMYAAFGGPRPK